MSLHDTAQVIAIPFVAFGILWGSVELIYYVVSLFIF